MIKAFAQRYRSAAEKPVEAVHLLDAGRQIADNMRRPKRKADRRCIRIASTSIRRSHAGRVPEGCEEPQRSFVQKCARDRLVVGSPDDCLAQLRRWQKVTPDYLILRIRQPGGRHTRTLDAIRLFGDRVIPKL